MELSIPSVLAPPIELMNAEGLIFAALPQISNNSPFLRFLHLVNFFAGFALKSLNFLLFPLETICFSLVKLTIFAIVS